MSFDKKEDKLQWIWIWMGFIILIAGCVLFTMYGIYLPYFSHEHAAWSSFGSLLSGFFTLTGTVATIATLLFLSKQNKDQQKVTQAQLDTLTFERYINHRKLFTDHLNELVATHKNTFTFRDPSHLYNSIFTMNSPHHCEFSVPPAYDENGDGTNHVGLLCRKLERIKSALDLAQPDADDAEQLVHDLIDLSYDLLMIEPVGNPRVGDMTFVDSVYGFNIFALNEFIDPAVKIANMILRFTNNPVIDGQLIQGNSFFIKEALFKAFFPKRIKIPMNVYDDIIGLSTFVWVYLASYKIYVGNDLLLPRTVKLLRERLFSIDSVRGLASKVNSDFVINVSLHEVKRLLSDMKHEDDHFLLVKEIETRLGNLVIHNA
ncbi:hypothetical protein ALP05_00678 [Pseudomonas caricapapayae]|uniref:Phage abortive infection protein n=1 Tax=Pseudomonas caricapapayae TaxID=46678 RepID=A0A3M6F779_9PSED|nr:hypothetical protein [Pseudomonas caricapapayae]RMV76462.1 hypothetical protein ALP05_00678 [Pseudomonas caricapapayae]